MWKGSSIDDLFEGYSVFERVNQAPDVQPSGIHTVLFELPLHEDSKQYPVPRSDSREDESDFQKFVKLPCSKESVYYELDDNEEKIKKLRWDLIKDSLTRRKIENSYELEAAIKCYNTKFEKEWNFRALHAFFDEELLEEQQEQFFDQIMPKIIDLALQLPELIQSPLPFLKQKMNHSISMSKQQAACLLSNAFLCTFPNRNVARKSTDYPEINFSRLFCTKSPHVIQKIKCVCNYFRQILTVDMPTGTLTYQRQYIKDFPKWSESNLQFSSIKWHIDSQGTIENGDGMVQVDFANKYLGGGVLGFGCVQEEIRFVICPELVVGMLLCEAMKPEETIVIYGAEMFNKYSGYSSKFKWEGNYVDKTPMDKFRRKLIHIVAMDALSFHKPWMQFEEFLLSRESNKAFCGFYHDPNEKAKPIPVATGNWGCGAFRGDKHLKCLLQFISCVANERNLVYYTFGDEQLMNDMSQMFSFLQEKNVTIGKLWKCLTTFKNEKKKFEELYQYIYDTIEDNKETTSESRAAESSQEPHETAKSDFKDENPSKRTKISNGSESSSIADLCEELTEKITENDIVEDDQGTQDGRKQTVILDYFKPKT